MIKLRRFMKSFLEKNSLEFLAYLRESRGASEKTIVTYQQVFQEALPLLEWVELDRGYELDLMPYRELIAHQSKKTIAKKVSTLRSFVDFMREVQQMNVRLKSAKHPKLPKTLPKPVHTKYIKEALEKASFIDRFIVELFYSTGLRISELASIRCDAIELEWIRVIGKGNKERMVPLLASVRTQMNQFRKQYQPKEYLFEIEGKRLSENQIRYRITKLFRSIGIKATPHQLRHSYATDLLNAGARITDVSELLGHAALSTTQIYTGVSNTLKMENYLQSHPLCNEDHA